MSRTIYIALGVFAAAGVAWLGYRYWVHTRDTSQPSSQPSKNAVNGIPQTQAGVLNA